MAYVKNRNHENFAIWRLRKRATGKPVFLTVSRECSFFWDKISSRKSWVEKAPDSPLSS